MAVLKVTPLLDNNSKLLLLDCGYINVASVSDRSVWFNMRHELHIDPEKKIKGIPDLLDIAFRQGIHIGECIVKQNHAQNYIRKIIKFFEENE